MPVVVSQRIRRRSTNHNWNSMETKSKHEPVSRKDVTTPDNGRGTATKGLSTLSQISQTCVIVRQQHATDALGGPESVLSAATNPATGDTKSCEIATGSHNPPSVGAGVFTLEDCV